MLSGTLVVAQARQCKRVSMMIVKLCTNQYSLFQEHRAPNMTYCVAVCTNEPTSYNLPLHAFL